MRISLDYKELLYDITTKNRSEVAMLEPGVRYRSEIGADKTDEVKRCLLNSLSTLTATYARFVQDTLVLPSDNELSIPETIEIDIYGSDRRLGGKTSAISNTMHSLLVNMTLSLFYISVTQTDLAKIHDDLAVLDVQLLKKLIYIKQPPCIC